MNISEALKLLSEGGFGDIIYDGGSVMTIPGQHGDILAKILGIQNKPDTPQKLGKGYVNFNKGDRLQFGKTPKDVLSE